MKKRIEIKQRNPLIAACLFRKAGGHGKTRKAERRTAKVRQTTRPDED